MPPRLLTYFWDTLPPASRERWLQHCRRLLRPAWMGTVRRTVPLSRYWGGDRGTPVDRYYIERFLREQQGSIQGRVLEVQDRKYALRYGTGLTGTDVLDIDPTNAKATIVADLAAADEVPSNGYDCFILTQTLQLIYDTRAAVTHSWRMLRPGGVLLATLPAVSRLASEAGVTDYWRFTAAACSVLFGEVFGPERVSVWTYGNVLACMAFLTGMAHEELSRRELEANDPAFPLVVAVRATKSRD